MTDSGSTSIDRLFGRGLGHAPSPGGARRRVTRLRSAWVGTDDGLLVLDRDGNGAIDSGRELFGNNTLLADGTHAANGFEALAELDDNGDGKIDAADAAWQSLRVWRDLDQDGVTDGGELVTLGEAGASAISLAYATSTLVDANGNDHRQVGSYTRTDGSVATATDVWPIRSPPAAVLSGLHPVER